MDELTQEQIEELRRDLLALKAELEAGLEGSAEDAKPVELDQAKVGRVSRMDAIQQQHMAAASRDSAQHRLALVRQALYHIEEGDFGYCRKCEEPVGYRRLKARPEAAFCVTCASSRQHH